LTDGASMTMFRSMDHSFWHDDPTSASMRERYLRRLDRFNAIDAHKKPVLFVRGAATSDEVADASIVINELQLRFGVHAAFLLVIDFQGPTAKGAVLVENEPNLMLYFSDTENCNNASPHCDAIGTAMDWMVGRSILATKVANLEGAEQFVAVRCHNGLRGTGGVRCFDSVINDPRLGYHPADDIEIVSGDAKAQEVAKTDAHAKAKGIADAKAAAGTKAEELLGLGWSGPDRDGLSVTRLDSQDTKAKELQTPRQAPGAAGADAVADADRSTRPTLMQQFTAARRSTGGKDPVVEGITPNPDGGGPTDGRTPAGSVVIPAKVLAAGMQSPHSSQRYGQSPTGANSPAMPSSPTPSTYSVSSRSPASSNKPSWVPMRPAGVVPVMSPRCFSPIPEANAKGRARRVSHQMPAPAWTPPQLSDSLKKRAASFAILKARLMAVGSVPIGLCEADGTQVSL